ncbi:DUF1183-domain-containing protein [Hymenopellis radicata]|nr:DUF1183-domain-containing protein [Hymenopellis radicata]
MSKVKLASISSLTFYNGADTKARRTDPVPQLTCVGKPCKYYQPDVIRCKNDGGSGIDVDWKCETDLPDSLRLGRVEVSCEGWSRPGDPEVLKGSCGLEYRLVEIPGAVRGKDRPVKSGQSLDVVSVIFGILFFLVLGIILYSFIASCLWSSGVTGTSQRGPRDPPENRPGSSSGWFPGGYGDDRRGPRAPPPPYSKSPPRTEQETGWQPGFWTGAALGGLGAHLLNRGDRREPEARQEPPPRRFWDWERAGAYRPGYFASDSTRRSSYNHNNDDRGEGTSNLGTMRRSTGLGGSNVR